MQTSKSDALDSIEETSQIKNSRIRIQLPKLETLDSSGLIPQTNHHDQRSNGFLSDAELGGKRKY